MGFSKQQKAKLFAELQKSGWVQRRDTVYAPCDGVWFSEGHLDNWTPERVLEIFSDRAQRAARTKFEDWEEHARIARQVCDAVTLFLKSEGEDRPDNVQKLRSE